MRKVRLPHMIDYYRKQKNLTMKQLGDKVGKSESAISKWIKGVRSPMIDDLEKLSEIFEVSVESLMYGANTDYSEQNKSNSYRYAYFDRDVAAGALELVEALREDEVEQIEVSDQVMGKYAGDREVFFTRLNGRSMDRFLPDHSLIAIKRFTDISECADGDIVLFSYDNGYSVKRFYNDKQNKKFIFRPESTKMGYYDIIVPYNEAEDLSLLGKVVLYIVSI